MGAVRGLRTRLCPGCMELTPHRTLYVRATIDGKRRWLQLFWACTRCKSLNHIILPSYRLERADSPLPSALAVGIVNTLEGGALVSDELLMKLKKRSMPGVPHIFNSDISTALEFLKGRSVVAQESRDTTERLLERLRAQSVGLGRLAVCHAEFDSKGPTRSVVTLYSQRQLPAAQGVRLVSSGVFCLNCRYQRIDV
jgi:hypothetical protein